jgi:hypothetical protein
MEEALSPLLHPMKTSPAFIAAALLGCVVSISSTARAQTNAGLLGQRYAGLSLFTESIRNREISNGIGGALGVNFPVTSFLDLAVGGSSESFHDYSVKDQRASAGLTAYHDFNAFKAFADASIGGTWQSSKVNGVSYRDNDGIYAFGIGIEAPFTDRSALFGRVALNQYFKRDRGHYWTYTGGANHWFNEKLGATLSVSFFENTSIIYGLGVTVRF